MTRDVLLRLVADAMCDDTNDRYATSYKDMAHPREFATAAAVVLDALGLEQVATRGRLSEGGWWYSDEDGDLDFADPSWLEVQPLYRLRGDA
jgi:hypothetical protein